MLRYEDKLTHNLNSGVALYFSNSSSHCASDRGGNIPVTGFHSVILSPDSVSRVMPPTTMIAKTNVDDAISHIPTDFGGRIGRDSAPVRCSDELLVEKNRFSRESESFWVPHEA